MGMMQLEGYALTHEGNVRENNEDNFYLFGIYKQDTEVKRYAWEQTVPCERALAGVFDGMGGEEAGEVASLLTVASVAPCNIEDAENAARQQLLGANAKVCERMRQIGSRMGATAVQVYFDKDQAVSANLGDSRSYLFRGNSLRQLSKDHSEGQRMIDMGISTPEEARKSKSWHKLTQHIGIFPEEFVIEPYLSERVNLKNGDVILIASDGLTDMLTDSMITGIMTSKSLGPLKNMAEALLSAALENGGRDNCTIVLVRVMIDHPLSAKPDISVASQNNGAVQGTSVFALQSSQPPEANVAGMPKGYGQGTNGMGSSYPVQQEMTAPEAGKGKWKYILTGFIAGVLVTLVGVFVLLSIQGSRADTGSEYDEEETEEEERGRRDDLFSRESGNESENAVDNEDTSASENAVDNEDASESENAVDNEDTSASENAVDNEDTSANENAVNNEDTSASENAVDNEDTSVSENTMTEENVSGNNVIGNIFERQITADEE